MGEAIERVNADLAMIERVRRFVIRADPFTIENEQLTPSLKIRRHKITAAHRDGLESPLRPLEALAPTGSRIGVGR